MTIEELVGVLPEKLNYNVNVWLGGRLARYGKTTENMIFYIGTSGVLSSDMMMYFNSLVEPLGFQATCSNDWKTNNSQYMMRLYNDGRLIIDKETMQYKEVPSAVADDTFYITVKDLMDRLPKEIEWTNTIYLTGGLVKNGFSNNDVDFIIFEGLSNDVYMGIRKYLTSMLNCKVHIGAGVMVEREPVYLYKIYEGGKICQ